MSPTSGLRSVRYDSLHGYADDVLEVLEALDLRDVVYVGHSVAATIGVLAETTDLSLSKSLVLVGPSPRYIDDGEYSGGFERADIEALPDALDANYLGWSQPWHRYHGQQRSTRPRTPAHGRSHRRPRDRPALRPRHVPLRQPRDFRAVRTPTVVLQCSDDVIAPTSVGRYVHEQIPTSRFVQLSATGHCPNLSAPDELADEIRSFLR